MSNVSQGIKIARYRKVMGREKKTGKETGQIVTSTGGLNIIITKNKIKI